MTLYTNPTSQAPTPLAASIGALLCLPALSAIGATHTVNNCQDAGTGSLRAVITAATTHSGDTLDLTTLMCSTISLKTGINVAQNNLTLNGPGENQLTLTDYAATKHRIFRHTGSGTLAIHNMSISNGYAGASASAPASKGGCISSAGNVNLDHVRLSGCVANGTSQATGGGIYARYQISLQHSTISGNTVSTTAPGGLALGGGAAAHDFIASDSSAVNNSALGDYAAGGGGLYVKANLTLTASTVSGNHTDGIGGGARVGRGAFLYSMPPAVKINNSTISGNDASTYVGGVFSEFSVTLQNSTIAFNTAGSGNYSSTGHTYFVGAGLVDVGPRVHSVVLQSSLLANNTYGFTDEDSDFSTFTRSGPAITVSGADNLIRYAHGPEPTGTLHACPLLGPLRDNGGETKTHALLSHSPGIDVGNNNAGFADDQRRSPFVRKYGIAADIGAYEVQADIIFDNGFDGCPLLPI